MLQTDRGPVATHSRGTPYHPDPDSRMINASLLLEQTLLEGDLVPQQQYTTTCTPAVVAMLLRAHNSRHSSTHISRKGSVQ